MIKYDDDFVAHVKSKEGYKDNAYPDGKGVSIGYGRQIWHPKQTRGTTKEEALKQITDRKTEDKKIREHLDLLTVEANNNIKRKDLSGLQSYAVLDAMYQFGGSKLRARKFFDKVNSGDDLAVLKEFPKLVNNTPNPKTQEGMKKRAMGRYNWWKQGMKGASQAAATVDSFKNSVAPGDEVDYSSLVRDIVAPTKQKKISPEIDEILEDDEKPSSGPEVDFGTLVNDILGRTSEGKNKKENMLLWAADAHDDKEALVAEEAIRLSKETGTTIEEAKASLSEKSYQDLKARNEISKMMEVFPKTVDFASDRENYPMYKEDPLLMPRIEQSRITLNKTGQDLDKAFSTIGPRLERLKFVNTQLKEDMTKDEVDSFIEGLEKLDQEIKGDKPYNFMNELKSINAESKQLSKDMTKSFSILTKAYEDHLDNKDLEWENILPAAEKAYKAGLISLDAMYDMAKSYVRNYHGTMILGAENMSSFISTFGTGSAGVIAGKVGGAILGYVTPVKGATQKFSKIGGKVGGAAGAFLGGGAEYRAEAILDDIEAHRNPVTGKVDYSFLRTKFQRNKVLGRANVQGTVGGVLSPVGFTLMGKASGRIFKNATKEGAKELTRSGLAFTLFKGFLAETGTQFVSEATEDMSAKFAGQLYRHGLESMTPEVLGKISADGFNEGAMGMLIGGFTGTTMGLASDFVGASYDKIYGKEAERKLISKALRGVDKARSAKSSAQVRRDIKKSLKESPALKYPSKAKEFINKALNKNIPETPKEVEIENENYDENNIEEVSDAAQSEASKERQFESNSKVEISANTVSMILTAAKIDEAEFIEKFGEDAWAEYETAKENNTDVRFDEGDWIVNTLQYEQISDVLDTFVKHDGNELTEIEAEAIMEDFELSPLNPFRAETNPNIRESVEGPVDPELLERKLKEEEDSKKKREEAKKVKGLPPIPGQEQTEIPTIENPDLEKEGTVLRQVNLYDRFENKEQRELYKKLRNKIRLAGSKANFGRVEADIAAEIEFNRMKYRAQLTGRNLKDMTDAFTIRNMTTLEVLRSPNTVAYHLGGSESRGAPDFLGGIRKSTIALRWDADVATLTHEFGHRWITDAGDDWALIHAIPEEKLTAEQKEYKEAMQTLAEELGFKTLEPFAESRYIRDSKRKVKAQDKYSDKVFRAHETLAQTVEKYFLEGKFENNRMRKALEVMRKFFLRIASAVGKSYNSQGIFHLDINPKIERALQGILGISAAEADHLYPMFPDPAFDPSILGARSQEYLDALAKTHENATAKFIYKAYRKNARERKVEEDSIINLAFSEADKKISAIPFMYLFDEYVLAEKDNKPLPISDTSLLNDIFDGDQEAMDKIRPIVNYSLVGGKKKKGVKALDFMDAHGIKSKAELIDVLTTVSAKDSLIHTEMARVMDKMAPLLKSDEELFDLAIESVNGEEREKIIKMEYDEFYKNAKTQMKGLVTEMASSPDKLLRRLDRASIRQAAIEKVNEVPLKQLSVRHFISKANKFGDSAARRFAKGDFIGAFEDKQEQVIYFEAYKDSQWVSKELNKTDVKLKRFLNPKKDKLLGKRYDVDVLRYFRQIAAVMTTRKKDLLNNEVLPLPPFDQVYLQPNSSVTQADINDINSAVVLFNEAVSAKTAKQLDVKSALALKSLYDKVISVAKASKNVENGKRIVETLGTTIELMESIENETREGVIDNKAMGLTTNKNQTTLRTKLSELYKSDAEFVASPLGKLYYEMSNASAEYSLAFEEARGEIETAFKAAVRKRKGLNKVFGPIWERVPYVDVKEKIIATELKNEKGEDIIFDDISEVLYFILYMGSESGKQKALNGGYKGHKLDGFGVGGEARFMEFVERLISEGKLTKEHFEAIESVWKSFEKFHPEVKKAIRKVDGHEIGTIKAVPFKTSLGTFSGGYVPSSGTRDILLADQDVFQLDSDTVRPQDMYPMQNLSMGNTRTGVVRPMTFNLSRITTELQHHVKIAKLRPILSDVGRSLNQKEFKEVMEAKSPGLVANWLRPWYDNINNQQYTAEPLNRTEVDVFAEYFRSGVYTTLFLGKALTGFKQLSGLIPSIEQVGMARVAKYSAIVNVGINVNKGSNYAKIKEDISSQSPIMKDRFKNHLKNEIKNFQKLNSNSDWVLSSQEATRNMSMFFINMFQHRVDVVTWLAAKDRAETELGFTGQDVINYADSVVETTQGSTAIAQAAQFNRGTNLQKTFFMLTTYINTMANKISLEISRSSGKPITTRAGVALRVALMYAALPGFVSSMLMVGFRNLRAGDDEDPRKERERRKKGVTKSEADWNEIGLNTIFETTESLNPIWGRIAGQLGRFMVNKRDISVTPMSNVIDSALTTLDSADRYFIQGKELGPYRRAKFFETVTLATKGAVPLAIISEIEKYFPETPDEKRQRLRRDRIKDRENNRK